MGRIFLAVVMFFGAIGCGPEGTEEAAEISRDLTRVSLHVEGMMCEDSCAKTVKEILASQPGVQNVVVNFENKEALCQVDPLAFDTKAAMAELADRGFSATVEK
jgi:copper chaperone CopZ